MTDKEITFAIVASFPDLASWEEDLGMFTWNEGRDEEIREFLPCEDPMVAMALESLLDGRKAEILYPRLLVDVARRSSPPTRTPSPDLPPAYWAINATPRHRAEAILRTLGKWVADPSEDSSEMAIFTISIDDGYAEYSYGWQLSSDLSIDDLSQMISAALGKPPVAPGEFRAK